jgi:hypothetical protein
MVNAAVAPCQPEADPPLAEKITFLSGEICPRAFTSSESALIGNIQGEWAEVSRGHSRCESTSPECPGSLTPPKD